MVLADVFDKELFNPSSSNRGRKEDQQLAQFWRRENGPVSGDGCELSLAGLRVIRVTRHSQTVPETAGAARKTGAWDWLKVPESA